MKRILTILIVLLLCGMVYADRAVMLDKATGKPLMSCTSFNPATYKQAMEADAVSAGIDLNTVEIKIISKTEWKQMFNDKIMKPVIEKKKELRKKRKAAKKKLKDSGILNDEDIKALFGDSNFADFNN